MSKKSLIGNCVEDFLDQLPERMEMTEISAAVLVAPIEGDEVICKASKATQKALLQFSALMKFAEQQFVRIEASDSKQEERDGLQDLEQNLLPLSQSLMMRIDVQKNLDLIAAGAESHSHQHLFVDRDLNVVRTNCVVATLRTIELATAPLSVRTT